MNSEERHELRYQRRKSKRLEHKVEIANKIGNYDEIFSFDNLYHSYKMCCKGVGWKASTHKYKANDLLNVNIAYKSLKNKTFKSKGFYEFDIVERGKPRHIQSVHISERVVQRCLCDYALVPILSKTFIYDNGACLKNKGIDFALNRMNCHLQKYYRKYGTEGYALVFDFSKYFDNIRHDRLIEILKPKVNDPYILKLLTELIQDFGEEKGLGLGSQISQICALTYPSKLDHYVKEKLGIKYYARYMDDGYLIHPDKQYLKYCLERITKICTSLGIKLNTKKTQIIKISKGINFLKTKFYLTDTGKVIRKPNRKGITKMRKKLKIFKEWLNIGRVTLSDIQASYKSWQGHMKKFNSYKILLRMDKHYKTLFEEDNK